MSRDTLPENLQQLTFGYIDSTFAPPTEVMQDEPQPNFKAVTSYKHGSRYPDGFPYNAIGSIECSNPFQDYNETPPPPVFSDPPIAGTFEVTRRTSVEQGASTCCYNSSDRVDPDCGDILCYALCCPCLCIPRSLVDAFYCTWSGCYEISKRYKKFQQDREDKQLANTFFNMNNQRLTRNIQASDLKEPLNSVIYEYKHGGGVKS